MKKNILVLVFVFLLGVSIIARPSEDNDHDVVIKTGVSFYYASMEFSGTFDNMEKNIGIFIGEFFKQGLTPAGPIIGKYYNDPRVVKPEELKWEVGFVVAKDSTVKAPLKKGEFNCENAAYYLYLGPYEKMDSAYDKIFKYVDEKGYQVEWPVFDQYLNNPKEVIPEELKTQMIVPLKKK